MRKKARGGCQTPGTVAGDKKRRKPFYNRRYCCITQHRRRDRKAALHLQHTGDDRGIGILTYTVHGDSLQQKTSAKIELKICVVQPSSPSRQVSPIPNGETCIHAEPRLPARTLHARILQQHPSMIPVPSATGGARINTQRPRGLPALHTGPHN